MVLIAFATFVVTLGAASVWSNFGLSSPARRRRSKHRV
jgi:hypothetical protein